MNKVLRLYLIGILIIGIGQYSIAQNQDYKLNIYAGTGFSLVGAAINASAQLLDAEGNVNTKPAIQLTLDRTINNWISIGGGVSYQKSSGDILNYPITSLDTFPFPTESFGIDVSRLIVGLRILGHYNLGEKIDLYSGLRLNYKFVKFNTTSANTRFDSDLFAVPGFGVQIIPIGVRWFINDNIGFSAETGIGAPHYLSVGLNYRI